jgi:hypothetical protein
MLYFQQVAKKVASRQEAAFERRQGGYGAGMRCKPVEAMPWLAPGGLQ